jgi:hypothetical protein
MRMKLPRPGAGSIVLSLAIVAALLGTAYAASSGGIPDAGGVFHGCVSRQTGVVRLVAGAKQCHKAHARNSHIIPGERVVTWSKTGPAGAAGVPGAPGAAGVAGPAGPAGPSVITRFACKTTTGTSDPSCGTLYDQDGLKLQAACTSNGFTARTSLAGAVMTQQGSEPAGFFFSSIQNSQANDGFILDPAANDAAAAGTIMFTPNGSSLVVRIDYSLTKATGTPQGDCVFVGHITRTP